MATSATVNLYGCCTEEWKTDVIKHEGEWRLRDTVIGREREQKSGKCRGKYCELIREREFEIILRALM